MVDDPKLLSDSGIVVAWFSRHFVPQVFFPSRTCSEVLIPITDIPSHILYTDRELQAVTKLINCLSSRLLSFRSVESLDCAVFIRKHNEDLSILANRQALRHCTCYCSLIVLHTELPATLYKIGVSFLEDEATGYVT